MLIKDIDPNLISEVAVPISKSSQIGSSSQDAAGWLGMGQLAADAGDVLQKGATKGWNGMKSVGSKIIGKVPPAVVPAATAAAPAVSFLSKIAPGIGVAAGTADAVRRTAAGDYIGAGLAMGTSLVTFIPVVGTGAALALLGAQLLRDKSRTGKWLADFDDLELADAIEKGMRADGSPKVFAAQNDLIKAGHKNITATGQMDQATEAALKSMAKKNPVKENMDFIFEDIKQHPTQDQIRDPAFCAAHGIETTWDSDTLDKDPEFVDKFMAARFWDKSTIVHNGKTYPVYQEPDYDGDNPPRAMEESTELARIRLLTHKLLNG